MRLLFLLYVLTCLVSSQFNIPLPFGNIGLNKRSDGQVEIDANQGFDLFGYGGKRKFKLVANRNGTFNLQKEDSALVNGSEYGGTELFGFDKNKGIDLESNLKLGDHKIVGGPGKEGDFLTSLVSAFSSLFPTQRQSTNNI